MRGSFLVPLHEVAARQRAVVVDFSAEDGEDGAFTVVLDGRHRFERRHVFIRDDEAVDIGVVFHVLGGCRLRQWERAELQAVADAELRDGDVVFFRHRLDVGIVQHRAVADGRIRFDEDAMRLRILDGFKRRVADVAKDLVDDGLHGRVVEDVPQIFGLEVRDADRTNLARFLIFFERFPRREVALEIMIALAERAPRLRRVDQHEVDIVEAEARERFLDALLGGVIRLEIGMELRRDKKLLARHARTTDALADFLLVAVRPRRVDVAVAETDRVLDRLRRRLASDEPRAKANFRDRRAVGKLERFI